MGPKFRLIEATISGVKCLDKPITIAFAKKGFDASLFDESLIKSIYGPNGSGKTAIITAFSIYRTIVVDDFPFKRPGYEELLQSIVNKKTNEFSISVIFATLMDDELYRLQHEITFSKATSGEWRITHEALHRLSPRLSLSKTIFQVDNGRPVINNVKEVLNPADPMLASNVSFIRLFFNVARIKEVSLTKQYECMLLTLNFALSLYVVVSDKQDTHVGPFVEWMARNNEKEEAKTLSDCCAMSKYKEAFRNVSGFSYFDVISPSNLDAYQSEIKKLCRFVKLLKQDLVDIEVIEKPFDQTLFIDLWFVYDGYKVAFEFESAGVKKLCFLFSALLAAKQGGIALIDEIDSNIHDTFLVKLFDYFSSYSDCQILCTTHNVEMMSVLSSKSKSIDFLSSDHGIVPWIKTGRLSPSVLYLKGRIESIPFNLDSSEFAEVFADEPAD